MKAYTDIKQSRKLAEILPLESADMGWYYSRNPQAARNQMWAGTKAENADIPCWSLAALLEQIPYEVCDDNGNSSYLQFNKEDDVYQLVYTDPYGDFESIETDRYEHFIDACYELILKLHELNLLL